MKECEDAKTKIIIIKKKTFQKNIVHKKIKIHKVIKYIDPIKS